MLQDQHVDFFVSYNHADESWATWIAWQLEQAGFQVTIQAWDFRPGNNFVHEMQQAAATADRTILVLTENYLQSNFTQPEWYAAFAKDPKGAFARVVPVRVGSCNPEGLLGPIIYIDLVDLPEPDAADKLMAGIEPGRAKPLTPPAFPGSAGFSSSSQAPVRTAVPKDIDWQPVAEQQEVVRSVALGREGYGYTSGPTKLEIDLPPISAQRLEVRRLTAFRSELADLGRQNGLFTSTQALQAEANAEQAYVQAERSRDEDGSGLLVTRGGQRSAWIKLPHDGLGSVLDESDAKVRIVALIKVLLAIDAPLPERFALAASLSLTMMLTIGSSDIIGRRSSASMSGFGHDDIVLPPEDSVATIILRSSADGIAEELVARLVIALNAR